MLALIDINDLTLTEFHGHEGVKEVSLLFILAESKLKNTITYIPGICSSNKKYAALSAAAIFNLARAIGSKPLNVC